MRLRSWKATVIILVILSVVILSVSYAVIPARGTLYKGDWCSFKIPDESIVVYEDDDKIVLEKYISDEYIRLLVNRFKDVISPSGDADSLDHALHKHLEESIFGDEEYLLNTGLISHRSSGFDYPYIADGTRGRTAYDTWSYMDPDGMIFGYSWAEGNDVLTMTLCWTGTEYLDPVDVLGGAYNSFVYHG